MNFHDLIGGSSRVAIITFLITLILQIPITLQAGVTGKISGKLSSSETRESLVGATIQLVGTNFGSISDQNGRFTILNILPGTYSVKLSYIGYEGIMLDNVQVSADLTTHLDLTLNPSVLEGEEVIVHAAKDIIEKDLSGTRAVVTQEQFDALPITQMVEALTLQSGVANSGNYLYVRGGRANQVAYLIDGVYVQDPLMGTFANDLGTNTIQELTLLSGTFNAEYGNAMSGIVNIVTRQGGRTWRSRIESRTGTFQNSDEFKSEGEQTNWNIGGPLLRDYLRVFISGNHMNLDKYTPWGFYDKSSYTTKLTFTGIPNVRMNAMYRNSWISRKSYSHRWKYIPEQYYLHK